VFTRYLISTICIVLLIWGCDSASGVPAKPTVVRKKITATEESTAKARTEKAVRTAKNPATAKPQTATPPAEPDKTQTAAQKQPAAETGAETRTLVAQTAKPAATQGNPAPEPTPLKKPTISPKSDITEIKSDIIAIKQSVEKEKSTDAGETVSADKLVASNLLTPAVGTPSVYDPTGKIDPFEPLFREKPVEIKEKKLKKRVPRTPLEHIDLGQLKLVGIILASSGNRALVEEASGKGYVIKKGTYIGINAGKVVDIQKEIVTVEEEFEDVFGKTQVRQRELKLPKPPGEF
jgi:type IV pilus assembly protein PilP